MAQASPAVPPAVLAQVLRILGERGDSTPARDVQRVKGGFESASARLTTGQRTYFLKWNTTPKPRIPRRSRAFGVAGHQRGRVGPRDPRGR